ncbi:hypothetical protein [Mariniblastus fucicola]|uniref:Alpha/beta hydrolase family protein n=1 Tax=Mariniblastus fucicola TaxID=980251 RepID=A0A5B9PFH8_9BACT|nr:hypothetical protein [Mariniblastus fucicola]QEG25034.1 hypothetical protein MFFC18_49570 [Mariniblastus fucicola]
MQPDSENPDKLVVVVHGVGDPQPGETLSLFTRSIAEEDRPLYEAQQTLWLNEKPDLCETVTQVKTFPAHVRRLNFDTGSIELVEAFWGDLSQVRRGPIGVICGMFQILFGLRYVAYVAADQPGLAAHWLKKLGLISSRILHGPVMAVAFYLMILTLAVVGTQVMWPQSYTGMLWTQVVLSCCAAVAFLASQVGGKITRSRVIKRFWFWVNITTAFVTGLMTIKHMMIDWHSTVAQYSGAQLPGLIWYCRVLVVLLGLLWFVETLVVLGMFGCWIVARFHPRANRAALNVAFLLPALAVGIWGQCMPLLWVSAKEGIVKLVELKKFEKLFDEAIPMLGVQFMMALAMTAMTVGLLVQYLRKRAVINCDTWSQGDRVPRLLVHPALQMTLGICTIIGVSLVMWISIVENSGSSWESDRLSNLMGMANKYAIAVLMPLGGIVLFLLPKMRGVFDIILDVVNHFYFRATQIKDALDDDDEFDIRESTFEAGTLYFSRRDQILKRIKRILAHYRDQYDHRPDLVMVAHSQGTVDVIETLNDPEMDWLRNSFGKITLVTMGSPVTHLYQHYFGHFYPRFTDRFWSTLHQNVDRWVNVFRVDDFVGLDIDFGHLPQTHQKCIEMESETGPNQCQLHFAHCSNHPVGARGHVKYWADIEVLEILKAELDIGVANSEQSASKAA